MELKQSGRVERDLESNTIARGEQNRDADDLGALNLSLLSVLIALVSHGVQYHKNRKVRSAIDRRDREVSSHTFHPKKKIRKKVFFWANGKVEHFP